VLVQGPVPGDRTLKDSIRRALAAGTPAGQDEVTRTVRATAAGLAGLHGTRVRHGDLITWEDELAEVRGLLDQVAARVPGLAGCADPLLSTLAVLAAEQPTDPPAPAHGSFRPGQVLLCGQNIGFIDFDGYCQAEPARDLALFRTTLQQLGTEAAHLAALTRVSDDFLAEYRRHAAVSAARVALWESLDLLTRVLSCWTKVQPDKLHEAIGALQRQLTGAPLAL
jgi:Ser/Thr protein kinase RdoA (MazF antagonist)